MTTAGKRETPWTEAGTAVVAAALLVATQVAGRATRDALFLSHFRRGGPPPMAAGAAIVSLGATLTFSGMMARASPGRVMPAIIGASGLLFLGEWAPGELGVRREDLITNTGRRAGG